MTTEEQYNALLIDPDVNSRSVLKQGISSVGYFDRVVPSRDLKEAQRVFYGAPHKLDVVFISERLGHEHVTQFIKQAQDTKRGKTSAYVIVLQSSAAGVQGKNASSVIGGADGFLCEPYSVDNIRHASELAVQVRRERKAQIMRSVFHLLVNEALTEVDKICFLLKNRRRPDAPRKRLEVLCSPLRQVDADSLQIFRDVVMEDMMYAKPANMGNYNGLSERIKKRIAEKIEQEEVRPDEMQAKFPWLGDITES